MFLWYSRLCSHFSIWFYFDLCPVRMQLHRAAIQATGHLLLYFNGFWLVACMVNCIHLLTINVQLSPVAMQVTGRLPFTPMLSAGRSHGRLCIFSIMA